MGSRSSETQYTNIQQHKTLSFYKYSDTSANEDNSFRNHIRLPKRDFP